MNTAIGLLVALSASCGCGALALSSIKVLMKAPAALPWWGTAIAGTIMGSLLLALALMLALMIGLVWAMALKS